MVIPVEYLAPWSEVDGIEGSFRRTQGNNRLSQAAGKHSPPQLLPLIINQDNYFPAGILRKD